MGQPAVLSRLAGFVRPLLLTLAFSPQAPAVHTEESLDFEEECTASRGQQGGELGLKTPLQQMTGEALKSRAWISVTRSGGSAWAFSRGGRVRVNDALTPFAL